MTLAAINNLLRDHWYDATWSGHHFEVSHQVYAEFRRCTANAVDYGGGVVGNLARLSGLDVHIRPDAAPGTWQLVHTGTGEVAHVGRLDPEPDPAETGRSAA